MQSSAKQVYLMRGLPACGKSHMARRLAGEPDSPWWQELRVLLKYKQYVDDELLDAWAKRLADATRETHRVPTATIRHWMNCWCHDLTMEAILNYEEPLG